MWERDFVCDYRVLYYVINLKLLLHLSYHDNVSVILDKFYAIIVFLRPDNSHSIVVFCRFTKDTYLSGIKYIFSTHSKLFMTAATIQKITLALPFSEKAGTLSRLQGLAIHFASFGMIVTI